MQGKWKNNLDNIELQNDSGRIVSIYYAKSVNSLAGGNDGGLILNDEGTQRAVAASTSNNSLGEDLSSDGSFRVDRQKLYNFAIYIKNYTTHNIISDLKGNDFNSIPLHSGRWQRRHYNILRRY